MNAAKSDLQSQIQNFYCVIIWLLDFGDLYYSFFYFIIILQHYIYHILQQHHGHLKKASSIQKTPHNKAPTSRPSCSKGQTHDVIAEESQTRTQEETSANQEEKTAGS
jgi:hypothetical protein